MTVIRFYNDNSSLFIDLLANNIEYCGKNFAITTKYVLSIERGKVETDELMIKWSKNECYIYDKLSSITLLEILYSREEKLVSITSAKPEDTKLGKYFYSNGTYVELYKNFSGDYSLITPENEKELITSLTSLGSYDVFITERGNKLMICSAGKKPPKYNGVQISKVFT